MPSNIKVLADKPSKVDTAHFLFLKQLGTVILTIINNQLLGS